jgi:rod shape determining protein RodA
MTPPTVSSPIRDVDDVPAVTPMRPAGLSLPFDPILLLAVIGLCAASLVTLAGATADDIQGDPNYYVNRQAIYFVVGLVLAAVLARIDYSRLRATKYVVYGLLIASILAVQALGTVARGSRRAIDVGCCS